MKSKRKMIAITVSLLLVIACLAGATVAYFTDTSTAADNTIVIGDVEIELYEDETQYDAAGANTAFAGVTAEDSINNYHDWLENDTNNTDPSVGGTYILPGYEVAKNTYLKNTGKNDAYVRFVVTVPEDLSSYLTLKFDTANYDVEQNGNVYYATYNSILADGDFTPAGLVSVMLKPELTEEQLPDAMKAVGGDRSFKINVVGQAVQTVGFASADAAFAETFDKPVQP